MRIAIVACFLIWTPLHVNAQQIQLQKTLTASPLGKMAFGVDVAPDGTEYAIAGRGDLMVILDAATNEEEHRIRVNPLTLAIGYSPDGETIAVLSHPGVLQVFSTVDWKMLHRITLKFRCGYLSFHPTEPLIAVAGAGPTVEIYNYRTGQEHKSIGKSDRVQGVMFAPDGESIFVNAWDLKPTNRSELRQYSLSTGSTTSFLSQHKTLRRIVVSDDQKVLATISPEGFVMIVGLDDRSQQQWEVDDKLSQFAIFLKDNRTLLVGGNKGWHVFDMDRNEDAKIIPASDVVNAYDGRFLPGTNDIVIGHTRHPDQLTRWSIRAQDAIVPPEPLGGFASMTPTIQPSPDQSGDAASMPFDGSKDPAKDEVTTTNATESPLFVASQLRRWTSISGSTIEAAWVGNDARDVLLRKKDGVETIVSRRLISVLDQQLLNRIDQMRRPFLPEPDRSGDKRDYAAINYGETELVHYREVGASQSVVRRVRLINDADVDSFGRNWVSCSDGLLTFREDHRFYFEAPVPNWSINRESPKGIGSIAIDRFDRAIAVLHELETLGEIVRYDGTGWTRIGMPNGLLAEDVIRFGDVIVVSGDFNGVAILGDNGWQIVEQTTYPDRVKTKHLNLLPDGKLLVRVHHKHPLIFDGKQLAKLEIPGFRPGIVGNTRAICPDHQGNFFMQDNRLSASSVYRFTPKTESRVLVYDSQATREAACNSIACASDGAIWIATGNGIMRRHGDDWKMVLKTSASNRLIPLADGRIWTLSRWLLEPTNRTGRSIEHSKGLYANFSSGLLPQRQEVDVETTSDRTRVWVDKTGEHTIKASLVKADQQYVTLRRTDGQVITIPVSQLSQDDQAFLRTMQAEEPIEILSNSEIDPSTFKYITFAKSGTFIGSDGKKVSFSSSAHGVAAKNDRYPELDDETVRLRKVNGVVSDKTGRIWVAGNAGLYEYVDGEFHYRHRGPDEAINHPSAGKMPTAEASRLGLDPSGDPILYFQRCKSFFRFENDEFQSLGNPIVDGKPRPLRQLFVHDNGLYGVGSFSGIARYSGEKWTLVRDAAGQTLPLFEHPTPLADGSVVFNAVNREDPKLRLWKWKNGRFEFVLEGIKPGQVSRMMSQGKAVLARLNEGFDRFLLRIDGSKQTVWNRTSGFAGVASDNSLWLGNGAQLERHDGKDWRAFKHGAVLDGDLYALDNGDIWVAGCGIVIISRE